MTATHNNQVEQGEEASGVSGAFPREGNSFGADTHERDFGNRLRAAREASDLGLLQCAQALRLPVRVLRQLERGDYEGMDSKVYLASYIGKYARHLGINEGSTQVELDRIKNVEPTLVATGGISHSRFLFDRYATAATYVVLTAVIVVPMIWLGVRGTLDHSLTSLAPLDATPVAQQDAGSSAAGYQPQPSASKTTRSPLLVKPANVPEQPLMASMAPFLNFDSEAVQPATVAVPSVPALDTGALDTGSGSHKLSLSLAAQSWVEVSRADGTRLEYGLLPAGTHKTFHSDQALQVRIGNAQGAQVSIDGESVALEDFRHANVAHFRMQVQDGHAAAASF